MLLSVNQIYNANSGNELKCILLYVYCFLILRIILSKLSSIYYYVFKIFSYNANTHVTPYIFKFVCLIDSCNSVLEYVHFFEQYFE